MNIKPLADRVLILPAPAEEKPIGVLNMIDNDSCDEKIIAVPVNDPNYCLFPSTVMLLGMANG